MRWSKGCKGNVLILAMVVCLLLTSACTAKSAEKAKSVANDAILGNYIFTEQIYMNPLSSFMAFDGFKEYYTLTEDELVITEETGFQRRFAVSYQQDVLDEQGFKNGFMMEDFAVPDISKYEKKRQFTLIVPGSPFSYRIYLLDEDIWLAQVNRDPMDPQKTEHIWSIFKIQRYSGAIPLKVSMTGTKDGVEEFLPRLSGFVSDYADDSCYNITPEYIMTNSNYLIFKYDTSCASFLLFEGEVYPLGLWFGGYGLTSVELADLNGDEMPELYFTYSFGSGLHRACAGYFDPISKNVITFDYSHLNKDMLVAKDSSGKVSLYDAAITRSDSFVDFDLEKRDFIADIVHRNGKCVLYFTE